MAHRHKMHHKAEGGGVRPKQDAHKLAYTGQGSHVEKEAEEKKRGGAVKRKEGGSVPGFKSGGRLDKRARGGRLHGSGKDMTKSPWSDAHVAGGEGPGSNPSTHARGGHVGK